MSNLTRGGIMKKYRLLLLIIPQLAFLYGMEEAGTEMEKKMYSSPAGSSVIKIGSIIKTGDDISSNVSMVSQDTSIQEIAEYFGQMVQINNRTNVLLADLITIECEKRDEQRRMLKLKKRKAEFDIAAQICTLYNLLGVGSSPHKRVQSSFGAWAVIQKENERLSNKMRKEMSTLLKKQEEVQQKKKKSKKLETARHTKKKTPRTTLHQRKQSQ
jgi:hypothetical protein